MLPIRTSTFESDENADVVISRLDWKVAKVKKLTNSLLNNSTADTAKPWVGKIDKDTRKFEIIQTAPFFSPRILEGNFFPLFVQGQIVKEGQKSKIVLTFRLGFVACMLFIVACALAVIAVIGYSKADDSNNWGGLLLCLVLPMLTTLLLILQLNRTENKLIDMFGV